MNGMELQLGILGTISAFVYRHRETKKNMCRGGRPQDLPNTDFNPAVRHRKKCSFTEECIIHTVRGKIFMCSQALDETAWSLSGIASGHLVKWSNLLRRDWLHSLQVSYGPGISVASLRAFIPWHRFPSPWF